MRIALVYQHFMVSGVGSTKPYDLARHLVEAGHDVTVICGRGYLSQGMDVPRGLVSRLSVDGIDVLCLGVDYQQRMGTLRRVASFLAFTVVAMVAVCVTGPWDVMLASSTPLTVGLVGLAGRYVRRVPFVFELRDLWPEVPYQAGFLRSRAIYRLSTLFEEWMYREAAAISAISEKMRRRLIDRGVEARKIHFIPTGADLGRFKVRPDRAFLRQNGLEGRFVAAYVGAHGRANNLDYLVEAAEHLKDDESIRIVLIGDGSEKRRLIDESRSRGLTGRPLVFLPPVARRFVPGILRACDVALMIYFCGPGMEYFMPNKLFDYLAAGLPIAINIPAESAEWVRRAGCGLVTDGADPSTLADAIRQIRRDPKAARRMGRRAGQLARERFDRADLHRRWEDLLASVARPVGGPAGRGSA